MAGEGDWGVLAGQNLNLGNTQITGEGKVILDSNSAVPYQTATGCLQSNLLSQVSASGNSNLDNRIIPVLNKGLPPATWWDLGLTNDTQSGSENTRIWSFDDQNTLECGSIVCNRDSDEETAKSRKDLIENNGNYIRLSTNEICEGAGSDCHIFIEHLNLTKTKLLIETSKQRPVVLHLENPGTSTVDPSERSITGSIRLTGDSKLCGVDKGSYTCNKKPEQLIILSSAPKPSGIRSCSITPETGPYVLEFEGNSLPYATIHLIPGIVKTKSTATSLNGLIWADSICSAPDGMNLITNTQNSSNIIRISTSSGAGAKGFTGMVKQ